jgi:hypothetical protein
MIHLKIVEKPNISISQALGITDEKADKIFQWIKWVMNPDPVKGGWTFAKVLKEVALGCDNEEELVYAVSTLTNMMIKKGLT